MANDSNSRENWTLESFLVKYMEGLVLAAMTIGLALVIFPFSWWRLIAVAAAVLVATTMRVYGRLTRRTAPIVYSYAVLVVVLVVGTVVPLFGANRFVLLSPSSMPWASRLVQVDPFRNEPQSLLVECHPVRKWLARTWMSESHRLIRTKQFASATFSVPSDNGMITVRENEHVLSTTVPYVLNGLRVDLDMANRTFEVADFPLGLGRLFTMTYADWPGNPPWHGVHVPDSSALQKSGVYAIWLHRLLGALCENDVESCFDATTQMIAAAPSRMEAARAYAIRSRLSEAVFSGNMGRHQRLVDAERAFAAYAEARTDAPGGVPDWYPTRGFVHAHLSRVYSEYGPAFAERRDALEQDVPPEIPLFRTTRRVNSVLDKNLAPLIEALATHVSARTGREFSAVRTALVTQLRRPSFFDSFQDEWIDRPLDEMIEYLRVNDEFSAAQLEYAHLVVMSRILWSLLEDFQHVLMEDVDEEALESTRQAVARAIADAERSEGMGPYSRQVSADMIPLLRRMDRMLQGRGSALQVEEESGAAAAATMMRTTIQIDERFPALDQLLTAMEQNAISITPVQARDRWWADGERAQFARFVVGLFVATRVNSGQSPIEIDDPAEVVASLRAGRLDGVATDAFGEPFIPRLLFIGTVLEKPNGASEGIDQLLRQYLGVDAAQILGEPSGG
ncbi:MAG: hypothetical protein ACF8R9_13485 [Phycisphaerales bacterium JB054]